MGDRHLSMSGKSLTGLVTLDDVIDVDVAPASLAPIDDLESCLFPEQVAGVPGVPPKLLRAARIDVRPGGCPDSLRSHDQIDAGLARVTATADQEVEVRSLDSEWRAGQGPGGCVTTVKRIDQPLSLVTRDGHLAGKRALRGARPERLTGHRPGSISRGFEVGDQQVGAARAGLSRQVLRAHGKNGKQASKARQSHRKVLSGVSELAQWSMAAAPGSLPSPRETGRQRRSSIPGDRPRANGSQADRYRRPRRAQSVSANRWCSGSWFHRRGISPGGGPRSRQRFGRPRTAVRLVWGRA